MKSKSTSSAPKEVIKDARKQGRRDGKNQIPRQEWAHNSVPYLMQLQRQYAAFGRELDLQLEEKKLAKETQKVDESLLRGRGIRGRRGRCSRHYRGGSKGLGLGQSGDEDGRLQKGRQRSRGAHQEASNAKPLNTDVFP